MLVLGEKFHAWLRSIKKKCAGFFSPCLTVLTVLSHERLLGESHACLCAMTIARRCSSVMLARPALLNCSIFKPDGAVLPLKEVHMIRAIGL